MLTQESLSKGVSQLSRSKASWLIRDTSSQKKKKVWGVTGVRDEREGKTAVKNKKNLEKKRTSSEWRGEATVKKSLKNLSGSLRKRYGEDYSKNQK